MVASASSLEQHVGLAVEHFVALLDRGVADPLCEVALAGAGRAEEERVLVLRDEVAGGEVEDEAAVELAIEVEVEGVEGLATSRKPACFTRRSRRRSCRRCSSSWTSEATRSSGAQ